MKYIFGNWKSNKNSAEVTQWFKVFSTLPCVQSLKNSTQHSAAVFVPSIYLPLARRLRDSLGLPISIGAQDISAFSNGAHTGEMSASMIAEYAQYVLIGHSERRKDNKENDDQLYEKVKRAQEANLKTVYCVQGIETKIPDGITMAAYEPLFAIGTGVADTPQNANDTIRKIKEKWGQNPVIYGGSVTAKNITDYLTTHSIDGVLSGGASLDPNSFGEMASHACGL
jgi:triosephosphate isomerase